MAVVQYMGNPPAQALPAPWAPMPPMSPPLCSPNQNYRTPALGQGGLNSLPFTGDPGNPPVQTSPGFGSSWMTPLAPMPTPYPNPTVGNVGGSIVTNGPITLPSWAGPYGGRLGPAF